MNDKELKMIQELMEELQGKMQYGKDDFEERLGRKKPEIEVLKVEAEGLDDGQEETEEDLGEEMPEDLASDMLEPQSPEEKLKQRLMKLRS